MKSRILGAKCKKGNMDKVITKQWQQLSTTKIERLLALLNRFEYMFDGTLVMWNKILLYLKFKDNLKTVCFNSNPEPKSHQVMSKKQFECLVILGFLEHIYDENGKLCTYHKQNQRHVR